MGKQSILNVVQTQYGAVARSGLSNESESVRAIAEAFGYSPAELSSVPPQANMGLSCGNPVAVAGLREGEVVVDLGCGGGLDVFLAAKRVGSTGKAIGVDMTPEMISRAQFAAANSGVTNVEFHLAQIDQLPLADKSVDCVISNCVINLVADKSQVFREIRRVLKPGGRVVISDIALKLPLPDSVRHDLHAYVGCIAGAIQISEYERLLREAGFEAIIVQDTGADLNAYAQAGTSDCCSSAGCCSTASTAVHEGLASVLSRFDANKFAASVRVHALRPATDAQMTGNVKGGSMKSIQVFDKPLCCSTGVCGPDVDPVLPRFAADLQWLKSQGHQVERFNLAQQPEEFIRNPAVHHLLATQGTSCLPLIAVNGDVVSRGAYPTREELERWAITDMPPATECCGGAATDGSEVCCAADEQAQAATGSGCGCAETGNQPGSTRCC